MSLRQPNKIVTNSMDNSNRSSITLASDQIDELKKSFLKVIFFYGFKKFVQKREAFLLGFNKIEKNNFEFDFCCLLFVAVTICN